MNASKPELRVGWYLEPPFGQERRFTLPIHPHPDYEPDEQMRPTGEPYKTSCFQTQNWWNDADSEQAQKLVSREAALYELARRHPRIGDLLLARRDPANDLDKLMLDYAGRGWPWLPGEVRETFRFLAEPTLKEKWRQSVRKMFIIISRFEWSEEERAFEFPKLATNDADSHRWRPALGRKIPVQRKVNQLERRAFERACERAICHLTRDK